MNTFAPNARAFATDDLASFNPFSAQMRLDPYPTYARLRDEAPVLHITGMNAYAVTRYKDVKFILKHPDLFISELSNGSNASVNGADKPEHTRLRKIVNRPFAKRRVKGLVPFIEEVVDELLSAIEAKGSCNLVQALSAPLPVTVLARLLGVPPERATEFKGWAYAMVQLATGAPSAEAYPKLIKQQQEFYDYFTQEYEARRLLSAKQAGKARDLLTAMVHPGPARSEETLSLDEALDMCKALLIGGIETTTGLISSTLLWLLRDPEQLAKLQRDRSLLHSTIQEGLRYDTPVQLVQRECTADTVLSGVTIPKGAWVLVFLGSANRDGLHFKDADTFDIARNPKTQLGFGYGLHYCFGAPLATLETKALFEGVLDRLKGLKLDEAGVSYHDSMQLRGPSEMRVTFEPVDKG